VNRFVCPESPRFGCWGKPSLSFEMVGASLCLAQNELHLTSAHMPYLTNAERLELGLIGCSDPTDEEVAAAKAQQEPIKTPSAEAAAKPVKRARNKKGEFQGDDPATPEVNEAFEAE